MKMDDYEIADGNDAYSIAQATHRSTISAIQNIIRELKVDDPKCPGLTWTQIDYILSEMKKMEPKIIEQTHAE